MVRKNTFILIILVLFISFAVTYALSYAMPMIPRHLYFLLPFYFVPIASTYQVFFRVTKTPKIVYVFIILILVINIPQLYTYNTTYSKENWRGLAQNLGARDIPRRRDGCCSRIYHDATGILLL